jgi:hypothetical protein
MKVSDAMESSRNTCDICKFHWYARPIPRCCWNRQKSSTWCQFCHRGGMKHQPTKSPDSGNEQVAIKVIVIRVRLSRYDWISGISTYASVCTYRVRCDLPPANNLINPVAWPEVARHYVIENCLCGNCQSGRWFYRASTNTQQCCAAMAQTCSTSIDEGLMTRLYIRDH